VREAAGAGSVLYVELRNPQNETLLYESTNMTTGTFDTPFSYRLVAGDLEKNSGASRTIFKPMNETSNNYTMIVGYAGPRSSSSSSADDDNNNTADDNNFFRSQVQFVFAYEHVEGVGAIVPPPNRTTTIPTPTLPPPEEPELEEEPTEDLEEELEEQEEEEEEEEEEEDLEEELEEQEEEEEEEEEDLEEELEEQEEEDDADDDDGNGGVSIPFG
jgi:hypothetical protein